MLKRYKEIIYGVLLGFAMWVVDAVMHAQLAADGHGPGSVVGELLRPGATELTFRVLFLVIATAFGWALWRANWRERELQALERVVVAFHRRLDGPAMRLVSHARMLQGRAGVARDEVAAELAASIGEDARIIDELAREYLRFSEQVRAGSIVEAVETLRRTEVWARDKGAPTSEPGAPTSS